MSTDENIVDYRKEGQVAYITLNRPKVLNAMNLAMHETLKQIWDDFEADDNLRVAVLSGAGDRAFSVGQDLKELNQRTGQGVPPSSFGSNQGVGWPRLTERFEMTKPVIAKVSGYAYGGGFELALACDLIIADDTARFALPEAKLGLIAGAGGVFRLLRALPGKTAAGYLMTGREIAANRAYQLGLLNEVVSPENLDECVQGWVKDLIRCAPYSVSTIKQVATESQHLSIKQAFESHYSEDQKRRQSVDCIEGPKAFIENREPQWGK